MPLFIDYSSLAQDTVLIRRALDWISLFHPDVEFDESDASITLTSERQSDSELEIVWECALANEIMHERAAAGRQHVLDTLVR